jgi:DNA-binding transcriptional ArsR family regulator
LAEKSQNTFENPKATVRQNSGARSQKNGEKALPAKEVGSQLRLRCSQLKLQTISGASSDLNSRQCFHNIKSMKTIDAVNALAALAQESRLSVFRLLVHSTPDGLTAGLIAEQLEIPTPTLSFHLKTLAQAGLVSTEQEGRFVRYRAQIDGVNDLVAFLTDDCCGGHPERCSPKVKK